MDVKAIRNALATARRHGAVSESAIDRLMLKVRDEGGLSNRERAELLRTADGFDDATQQRLYRHLSAMGQTHAWVNVDVAGQVVSVEGRYANLSVSAPGLSARVGLFDSAFALSGVATSAGTIRLALDGLSLAVEVKPGDGPQVVLERLKAQLPPQFAGVVVGGDVRLHELASFDGPSATRADGAAHLMLYKPAALALRPGETPLRVVVTGYGAFMGLTDNPSAAMAQRLASKGVEGAMVEYRRLDVTPAAVDAFLDEMRRTCPDVILSMGVGGRAQLEERPENQLGAAHDGNDQPMQERVIRPGLPTELPTDLPVEAIDWALEPFAPHRQVFTSRSDEAYQPDRSAYLCNYLGFHLAAEFGQSPTTAGFMHVTERTPTAQAHAVLEAVTARQRDALR